LEDPDIDAHQLARVGSARSNGRMQMGGRHHFAPSASIAPYVESFAAYSIDGETPHVAIPRPEIDVVVRFGPAARGGIDAHAFGARERVHRKIPRGVLRTLSARLRLGAPEAVLGVPASRVARRIVALEDLWGETATRRLYERLVEARDAQQAVRVFEGAIADRLALGTRRPSPIAIHAANKLASSHVNVVAGELGVSDRHLRRVFRESVGIGPKAYAKLARFRRALRAAREQDEAGWAHVATVAGYYDQAHLIAEFRAIADATPRAFLTELASVRLMG
jgi:AraC-like DNA-binding protein